MGSELSFGKTLCILQSANLWTRYFLAFRRLGCPGPAKRSLSVSAISQNRPAIIEIKGSNPSHSLSRNSPDRPHNCCTGGACRNVLKVSLQTQVCHLQGSLSGLISKPRTFGTQPDWALN